MDKPIDLVDAFLKMRTRAEMEQFFSEIFTDAERKDLLLRWQLLRDLYEGKTQREIAALHKISLCKITRGAKILKDPESLVHSILKSTVVPHQKNK